MNRAKTLAKTAVLLATLGAMFLVGATIIDRLTAEVKRL